MTRLVMPFAGWRLTLDGRDLTGTMDPLLARVTLSEKRGGEADQLDIILEDRDGRLEIPKAGVSLRLAFGWRRGTGLPIGLIDKGSFRVDEARFSGPPDIVTIRARSADFTAGFRVRRERAFVGRTVRQIVEEVAAGNSLTASVDETLGAKPVPALGHGAKSDAALLSALGRRFDATATVKAGTLIFAPIGKGKTAGGKTLPTVAIARTETSSIDYGRVERESHDGAEAVWHDSATGQRHTVQAGHKGTGTARRIRKVHATEADAQQAAEAENSRQSRAKATATIDLAYGRPDIIPEQPVTLSGFKAEIDARKWVVAEASHSMDGQGGLTSRLSLETLS